MTVERRGGEIDPASLIDIDPASSWQVDKFTYGNSDWPRLADGTQLGAWEMPKDTIGLSKYVLAALHRRNVIRAAFESGSFSQDGIFTACIDHNARQTQEVKKLRPKNNELELILSSLTTVFQQTRAQNWDTQLTLLNRNVAREREPLFVRFGTPEQRLARAMARLEGFYVNRDQHGVERPAPIVSDMFGVVGKLPLEHVVRYHGLYVRHQGFRTP